MVSMVPGGAQRRIALLVAFRIAAPLSCVPGWPMKPSAPAALQMCPGTVPWTFDWGGTVAQAARASGAINRAGLGIDALLLDHPAHLQFSILDGEGEPSFDQVQRVLAE